MCLEIERQRKTEVKILFVFFFCFSFNFSAFGLQIPSHKQSVASSQEDRDCLWRKGIWKGQPKKGRSLPMMNVDVWQMKQTSDNVHIIGEPSLGFVMAVIIGNTIQKIIWKIISLSIFWWDFLTARLSNPLWTLHEIFNLAVERRFHGKESSPLEAIRELG